MKKHVMVAMMVLIAALFGIVQGCGKKQGQQQPQAQGGQQATFRMSQFVGASIQTQQGQSLGDVQDVVVNKQGQPLYLVLSGSEFNKQNQMVAVPWQTANPQFRNGNIIISLSKQQLGDAPSFPEDNWAELEQNQQQINAYFGSHGAQAGGQQQGQMGTQQQSPQSATQQQ